MSKLALLLGLALMPLAGAAEAQEKVYPALQEPMHKPVFHNEKIDVYDVQLKPGEGSCYHRHSRDQLGLALRSGASFNQALGDGEIAIRTERGSISYIPYSATVGYTHRVRATTTPFRVVGIEFAKPAPSGAARLTAAPSEPELVFPQGKITRVTIAAGTDLSLAGSLIVAMTAGTLTLDASSAWTFGEGDVRWIGDAPGRIYRNGTTGPVELLVLTLND